MRHFYRQITELPQPDDSVLVDPWTRPGYRATKPGFIHSVGWLSQESLRSRLELGLSILTAIFTGRQDESVENNEKLEEIVRDVAAALTGKEIEFKEPKQPLHWASDGLAKTNLYSLYVGDLAKTIYKDHRARLLQMRPQTLARRKYADVIGPTDQD